MPNKKINQLDSRVGATLSDLILIGDPTSGTSYKLTASDLATLLNAVPYTGANTNVNLGEYGISSGYFQADLTPTLTGGVGRLIWSDTDGTLLLGLKGGNLSLKIGQNQYARVVNGTGGNVLAANYQVVKVTGAQGQRLQINLAQANNDANSTDTLGLIAENINNNQTGFICTSGLIEGINTTGSLQGETWNDGDVLYLSPTIPGAITKVKPTAPDHSVIVGFVVYAHANNGKIFVKVDNGYESSELHDIYTPTKNNNDGIFWVSANNRYESKSISSVLGYTPVATTRSLTINGTAFDLSADRTWTIPTHDAVTIGTANGLSLSTQVLSLDLSSGSTTGALSSSDWTTFNNKQSAISLTTTGSSGAATFVSNVLNVPNYTLSGLGGVPTTRTLTINGTAFDLSADRSWTISGTNIYTSDGTLTGNRTLTNSTYSLTFVGGIEVNANEQRGLILQTSATNKTSIEFVLNNTFTTTGKAWRLRSLSGGDFDIVTGSSRYFYIANDGKIVVNGGAAISSAQFSVSGKIASNEGIQLQGAITSPTGSGVEIEFNGGVCYFTGYNRTASSWHPIYIRGNNILFQTAGNDRVSITNAGRLLVGTTTESTYLVDVAGTARVAGTLRQTQGGNNYIDIIANANGSAPYIDLFYSGTIATRINSYVAMGGSFSNGNGILFGDTSGNSLDIKAKRIFATDLIETKSNLYLSGASGNRIQFFEPGVAYRGNIGVQNGTSYIQVRTGSATNLTDGTLCAIFDDGGSFGVGGMTSINASARMQIDSTTKGFLPPRMTTTQKNAITTPAAGLVVYDTTTNKLCCYNGTTWNDLF